MMMHHPQYVESNYPYGGPPPPTMGYNQMPNQPSNDAGNQVRYPSPQYGMPPPQQPQQFGNPPPPQNAYQQPNNPIQGKVAPPGPPVSHRPPFSTAPSQQPPMGNVNYQNGNVPNPPVSQSQPPRMQGPPMQQSNYHGQGQPPHMQGPPPNFQQHSGFAPPQRPMGMTAAPSPTPPPQSSGFPPQLTNQMNNLQLNSEGAQTSRPPLSNTSGSAFSNNVPPARMQQPPTSTPSNAYASSDQMFSPIQNVGRPPMAGPPPSTQPGAFPPSSRFPNAQYQPSSGPQQIQQLQDFGHRLPAHLTGPAGSSPGPNLNQQPMSNPPSNQPPLSNTTGNQPPYSNFNHPPITQPQVSGINNGGGFATNSIPPYSGPPTSHQFNMGPTPPPNQYGAGPSPQYPGSITGPPGMHVGSHGMPPQPTHAGPAAGHGPQYPGSNQAYNQLHQGPGVPQPQQQQRRLDPEMMPSPIQVMEDDRRNRTGEFCTNIRGQVPPLVTTKFITQDQGNCSPRFIRSTMYTIPCNPDMLKQTYLPFVLSISPFARLENNEIPPPIVQLGEGGPTRCIRCKAYMCPFMQFIDGGRRFQCSFCRATTEVPPEYFAHLDHTGLRVDKYERPELCLGSYEFIATKDYCKNNIFPLPPAFIFIIDVSYNNIKNGVVQLLCQNMKTILANLPKESSQPESQVKVGFITYSNTVQFYNLKSCLSQPQVLVVSDVHDMFMPLLDGFLVGLDEAGALIDNLMEQIPEMYVDSRETETILGPVIQAGLEALKAADRCGKLFVFHSSLPIADAPGKLKNRDDRKLLGTEKEKTVLAPQSQFYTQLGQECVAAGCSVDLFTFPNAYIDIATIGQVSRLTGGQVHKYTYFVAEVDGERLIKDLCLTVKSQVAFDGIMRVRTSTGVRPVEFHGNYYMSNTTDVELAALDTEKAVCTEIKHDDKLTDEEAVYIQTAILYTSVGGQRRLRIHNLSLNTCTQMADLYKNCELDAIMNFYSKSCLRQLCDQTPKQVKDSLISKCAQGLACYRKNCATPSSAGQLILPECMKLLPLYVNCLLKNDALAGGSDMTPDDRSFDMHCLNSMNVGSSLAFIYPRLLPLHDLDYNNLVFPSPVRTTIDKLKDDGIYILENGLFMFMWVGASADSKWLQNVFGVQSAAQIDIDKTVLLELENPYSLGVRQIINQIRDERHKHLKLIIIRQRDRLEVVFKHFLVEDKGIDGSPSYVDFLCHVHKEIRNLLS
ncbi:hypothetical protein CHUAL_002663 [Chamberlinius hualienensis]